MHNSKTKSTQELEEKLVQDHYGLVISQALAFFEDQYFEDYVQVGLIGLLKAIIRYDYSKSDFASYANICIANSISKLNKKLDKYGLRNSTNVEETKEIQARTETVKYKLPEFLLEEEKFILNCRFQGYTNSEISGFIGCGKEDVRCKVEQIITKLKARNE